MVPLGGRRGETQPAWSSAARAGLCCSRVIYRLPGAATQSRGEIPPGHPRGGHWVLGRGCRDREGPGAAGSSAGQGWTLHSQKLLQVLEQGGRALPHGPDVGPPCSYSISAPWSIFHGWEAAILQKQLFLPCRAWDEMIFRVPPNPNNSVIL